VEKYFLSSQLKKTKTLLHIDGDAFFVGVEIAKNPKLRGLPVVTGEERGIVSALSYEAKALGITRGMPIYRVNRDFPNVIVLPGDYKSYVRYSNLMFNIVRRYADDVEEYSIDECFADLTGLDRTLKMTYRQIAERIKREINDELNLSVSIGLAPTKVLAKIASKWVKPNGLTVIDSSATRDFLVNFPIEKIWGIGPRTSEFLKKRGINTAYDFSTRDLDWVKNNLSKPYETIWRELNCERVLEIDPKLKTTYSSIQKTRSFHPNTNDATFLFSELSKHVEDACAKARHYKLATNRISFFLKTKDFKFFTCTISLTSPANVPEMMLPLIREKFATIYKKGVLYRTTGVILQNLSNNYANDSTQQQYLFEDMSRNSKMQNKFEIIHNQIDLLEAKFGKNIVHLASSKKALKNKRTGTDYDDLDRDLLFL
jgi:nucleotidyltransferase/DNA polymerase involved in DNA repair